MKQKQILLTILFLLVVVIVDAQPHPPTTPYGNPVPIGGSTLIIMLGLLVIGTSQLIKNKK